MHGTSESDVAADPHLVRTRETGGSPTAPPADRTEGDTLGTTGSGETESYVGRVAGDDLGYAGETGAEARAQGGETNP